MQCPRCAHDGMVEIKMRLHGEDVAFRRCGRCEHQRWSTAGGDVALGGVLQLARAR